MTLYFRKRCFDVSLMAVLLVLMAAMAQAQVRTPAALEMPQSHNPFSPYNADRVPEPALANSPRLSRMIRDGKLYLSLKDAVDLALENNLDLAIARYNLPIADTDLLRTKAGGSFRGVNTGVVQGTPGGGVGGYGAGAPGAGAGGTTGGAGGAGAGASGLVQSTLGAGTPVASYDPALNVSMGIEHLTSPLSNEQVYGIPSLQLNTAQVNASYTQAFATGTTISFEFNNNRQTTNSPDTFLSPALNSYYRFSFQQELLAGFGFGPNLRYLRIANNNKKISDIAFKDQVIATVTQIENIYWDLVNAYEQARVNEQSLAFANQTLENAKKQLQLESVPQMDVMKAEAEVSKRDQDLTVARTNLQLQESLMKNARADGSHAEHQHRSGRERADSRSDWRRTAESSGTVGDRRRPREPANQPPSRAERASTHALPSGLLRRQRSRGIGDSRKFLQCPDRPAGRVANRF
jgi:outer membrane protein TolC